VECTKLPKLRRAKLILTVDREETHGARSFSPETWHSKEVELYFGLSR
jgi:hypothetical protein